MLRTFPLVLVAVLLVVPPVTKANQPSCGRPNLLFILTEQQAHDTMSCAIGREHLHTPAMDGLAADGMRFTRAYTASPVCIPARNSIFTGRHPHDTQIECNRPAQHAARWPLPSSYTSMGVYFRDAGYDTAYFGKWHLAFDKGDRQRHGFMTADVLEDKGFDPEIVAAATQFLQQPREKPFFAVVSLCDPHDICQHAMDQPIPSGPLPEPPRSARLLPPLRPNAAPTKNAPDILTALRDGYLARRQWEPVPTYDERGWREYIWAYYRLVERLDASVGKVLDALRASGHDDNTVVVFTADHGDQQGAHGLPVKTWMYEESVRVPLILWAPGHIEPGRSDKLANIGVDVLPTLLDYAGIAAPGVLPGRSLRPVAEGREGSQWREYVVSAVHFCSPLTPRGTPHVYCRMVCSGRYKYWLFDRGEQREMLFDLQDDPGELVNLAFDPAKEEILRQHRAHLSDHAQRHGDTRATDMLSAVEP